MHSVHEPHTGYHRIERGSTVRDVCQYPGYAVFDVWYGGGWRRVAALGRIRVRATLSTP